MHPPKHLKGLEGMLAFLNYLRAKHLIYRIEHLREDSLMVTFTMLGVRVEVDFFSDHIEFSDFQGSEDVQSDEADLLALIAQNTDE